MSSSIYSSMFETPKKTAIICFADGRYFYATGFGKTGHITAEICFNTAMTGYQEILSDPSYASQIVTFTFPHIGNVGTTPEDLESKKACAAALICREEITHPSNWRATNHFEKWTEKNNLIGVYGVDTRALTDHVRKNGMPKATICHNPSGEFDIPALVKMTQEWDGLEGMDLAAQVSCSESYKWHESRWDLEGGFLQDNINTSFRVVAIDYGIKHNILRCLYQAGCDVTVVPANASLEDILSHNPDGMFLSNGPGDPAATAIYAVPVIQELLAKKLPVFGICLGHQLLALALGAKTKKMKFGHHGANHPVQNIASKKVEITSMNHGFTIDTDHLSSDISATHISLFDGSNCGIKSNKYPAFSVQFHPEASPGPQDSFYLFESFAKMMAA